MADQKKKSTKLKISEILLNGLIDLIVGTLLILISKLID